MRQSRKIFVEIILSNSIGAAHRNIFVNNIHVTVLCTFHSTVFDLLQMFCGSAAKSISNGFPISKKLMDSQTQPT
jgi:hypothetical protein